MENNESLDERLKSLEAFLISKEKGGVSDALELLGESTSPELVRRRLGILIDSGQIEEAVEYLKTIPLHERWCERAIHIYVKTGDIPKAKELIEWAKERDDELLKNRCRFLYAEVSYNLCWKDRKKGDILSPDTLSNKENATLADCLSVLNPMLAKAIAENQVSNEVESLAVQLSIEMLYLLNRSQEAGNLCNLLSKRKPLPLRLGRFALSGIFKIQDNAPERYRAENSKS